VSEFAPAEPLDPDGFAELRSRTGEGPVVMLNLIELLPDGGAERYAEYGEAVAPLLAGVGGRLLFAGRGSSPLIGSGRWDMVLLVEYPSREAFLEMIGSDEYAAIAHLRTEAIARSELRPLDPESPDLSA
jgi:uncharacterized protein (DUF1330 family)